MTDNQDLWGFGPSPAPVTIFIGEAEGEDSKTPWYEWDFDNEKKILITETALYGTLSGILVRKKEYKGKEGYKTLFVLTTPFRQYVVTSGSDTVFTRKLLLLLETVQDLSQKLCITVKFGDEGGKVVFPSLWVDGFFIKADWDPSRQLFPLVNELRKRLGQPELTIKQIDKEFKEAYKR